MTLNQKRSLAGIITIVVMLLLIGVPVTISAINKAQDKKAETSYYENGISYDSLKADLDDNKTKTIYFYNPNCTVCKATSPIVFPIANELGVELTPYDTTKYSFDEFGVTGTPTIIRFEDGNIVDEVNGNVGEEAFREFFGKYAAAAN